MFLKIDNQEVQRLAVACARAQLRFPYGSREAKAFESALRHIVVALENQESQGRHASKAS